MSAVDLIILVCIFFSAVLAFFRGILRAIASVGIWLAAIVLTLRYSSRFASLLPIDSVESPLARASISAFLLFFGTLAVGITIIWFIERIFPRAAISLINRILGFGFGFVRGVILVVLLVLAAHLIPDLKQEVWWNESRLIPQFSKVAKKLHTRLPESIRQHFHFDT
ncbi:MAG: CvpA family protein [Granulosicoccus sp.]|nr:CvpA family protein [Granulosicoccus sp.]